MPSASAGLKGHSKVNIFVTLRISTTDSGSQQTAVKPKGVAICM